MSASPFPQGTLLKGDKLGRALRAQDDLFWIHKTKQGRRALLLTDKFCELLPDSTQIEDFESFSFGGRDYRYLIADRQIDVIDELQRPEEAKEALAFATALAPLAEPFGNAIYLEEKGCLLGFAVGTAPERSKAEVLGRYLSGGVDVGGDDIIALARVLPRMEEVELVAIALAAGLSPKAPVKGGRAIRKKAGPRSKAVAQAPGRFELPGRPALAEFFNEHVVEIVADEERYAALGIGFPGGIVLEGPTGCGKTFAVERLIEHLGWPSFKIEASSVASPYIHETSRKVAQVFAEAVKAAPAVIVIDEMDAFLSSRDAGAHHHQVEEVAEFLRRIPEASKDRVLVIGMTNQIDAIDTAILRRGRFDHVIHVDHAGRDEIAVLLAALLADIPNEISDLNELAQSLAGRPLSDVSFVVREAGRLAARARKDRIGPEEISAALKKNPSREPSDQRRIGF